MVTQTRIVTVVREDGTGTYCPIHPNALLMEVIEGQHTGKRGCDGCLFDLVGPIRWDKTEVSVYETGERKPQ